MPSITIDGTTLDVEPGLTVIQACELAGVEIPRFCYHERLAIAGNCRMCLVEMEKAPKPIASCAMPVADGMVIHTNTDKVKKAREGVMEFLLINHPLDCPICDQGGECDLQDQAYFYGRGGNRFDENKRAVPDKYMGPLIKTHMTRCIHCTRCIRFATDVAGVEELGAVGRGEHMEVTTYVEKALTSELSGNVVDLCPVGALTSRPYAFKSRPWELRKTESIDVLDAVGSNIRVDARGREVMRILPRLHEDVNEEWISDKTRYAYDGLKAQRLDRPYVRRDGTLRPASWAEAFTAIGARLASIPVQAGETVGQRVAAIAGDMVDCESLLALQDLLDALGSPHRDCRQDGAALDPSARAGYLFNTTMAGIAQADACLLIGTNPRTEAPVLNARLRRRYLAGGFNVASLGLQADFTYPATHLGDDLRALTALADGSHPYAQELARAERPMLILGMGALRRADGMAVLAAARAVAESCGMVRDGWNGFNVLHTAAARVGALDLGFVPQAGGRDLFGIYDGAQRGMVDTVFLHGADEVDMPQLGEAFVVYIGHHGDAGAHRADVILPGAAYTEKSGTYVNTEGRAQRATQAVTPPGDAREDWTIFRALAESLGVALPYNTLEELRATMAQRVPHLGMPDALSPAPWTAFGGDGRGRISATPCTPAVRNFYMTDPISRASRTMAACTAEISGGHLPNSAQQDMEAA